MINKYISDICDILEIAIPKISYDTSNFKTLTTMAQCKSDGSTIYIRKLDKPNPDYMFSIAHELRHVWQIQTDYDLYLSDYKPVDILGIEKYNNQLAEIDAHAFASIVMMDFFNLAPLYNGLSEFTISLIEDRIDYIIRSLE